MTPTYDGNGNLTSDACSPSATMPRTGWSLRAARAWTATYAYDARGRRKSKTVNGVTTIFVADTDNRDVLEYAGSDGQVQRWYAYVLGPNEVLNQIDVPGNARATFVADMLGSIVGLVGGGALSKNGYAPYGKSAATTTFAFTGQRKDNETGGLHYYRARMYAPAGAGSCRPIRSDIGAAAIFMLMLETIR